MRLAKILYITKANFPRIRPMLKRFRCDSQPNPREPLDYETYPCTYSGTECWMLSCSMWVDRFHHIPEYCWNCDGFLDNLGTIFGAAPCTYSYIYSILMQAILTQCRCIQILRESNRKRKENTRPKSVRVRTCTINVYTKCMHSHFENVPSNHHSHIK